MEVNVFLWVQCGFVTGRGRCAWKSAHLYGVAESLWGRRVIAVWLCRHLGALCLEVNGSVWV